MKQLLNPERGLLANSAGDPLFCLQVQHYTEYIKTNPAWEFVDVYTDEGMAYGQKPVSTYFSVFMSFSSNIIRFSYEHIRV